MSTKNIAQAFRNKRTDLCRECKPLHHDMCGMKRDCKCCDTTRAAKTECSNRTCGNNVEHVGDDLCGPCSEAQR